MGILKKTIAVSALLASVNNFASRASVQTWESYFPRQNCSVNECAKNVPNEALEAALEKISYMRPDRLKKTKWMYIADFTQHSSKKRGYLINLKSGKTITYHVAHGRASGDARGNTLRFSNRNGSHMSSKGLYITAETYYGKHGYSLRMDGLEHTNSAARRRAIVIHGAKYMRSSVVKRQGRAGRSLGCPAVDDRLATAMINKIKGGSAYYIHGK